MSISIYGSLKRRLVLGLGLEIIARWGPLPIRMVHRSERSLKLKMLSLARTSKYANTTSVLNTKKV